MTTLTTPTTSTTSTRAVQRVRHPLKARLLRVQRVHRPSPGFVCVTLGGDALHDFVSASFDDHVKLMLPSPPGAPLVLPERGPDGPILPPGAQRPVMRDYTPRRFDTQACELDLEFALHGDGPAASWAAQVAPGQQAGIGGPRGSFIVPPDYDWHLLIGDDTALPAIARRLEELPSGAQAIAVIQTQDAADHRALATRAQLQVHWVAPGATGGLAAAVQALSLPPGEGHAWAAGEAAAVAATRRVLVGTHGLDKDHIRAAAYWKHGAADHHETL